MGTERHDPASAGDKDDLYLTIFRESSEVLDREVLEAIEAHEEWHDGLRAAAYAAARDIRDNPREVRFGVAQTLATGDLAQVYRERQPQGLVGLIDLGRQRLKDPESTSRGVADA